MIKTTDNRSVIDYAMAGRDANGYGAVWTRNLPTGARRGGYQLGYLPTRLKRIFEARSDSIVQVIYSYGTPIAWLDAGAWVVPSVSYSVTTGRHQGSLWKLPARVSVMRDATLEDYLRILNGQMVYDPHTDRVRAA